MTQEERRIFLIKYLLSENIQYGNITVPKDKKRQEQLLRSLMNVRPPREIGKEFLNVQNIYLKERAKEKGIVNILSISQAYENLYLWQGDITTLKADVIVNAANSGMTGCYCPCHDCIDNCIHTFAGVQLRFECDGLMRLQGYEEPTGRAKITKAYNLPCKYVLHTVGPVIAGEPTHNDEKLLSDCYKACLGLAEQKGLKSIAFCCISTGEFRFPNRPAAEIAVQTVRKYIKENKSEIKVIFNVFKNEDYEIYKELLRADK